MDGEQPDQAPATPPSLWVDLDGPVHYMDFGGPDNGPLLVLVHGLGGSLINWAAVAPMLAESCRVVALDMAGFGRTRSHGRRTTVAENRRLLDRFLTGVCRQPAILVGNSMGGLIAALQAAGRPESVTGLVLVDPALPVGPLSRPDPLVSIVFATYALPAVGRKITERRRRAYPPEATAKALLQLCCADASRVPKDVLEQHLELARERHEWPDIDAELIMAARSLLWVLARRRRLYAQLQQIAAPVLLIHGDQDRLVPLPSARKVARQNPHWRFEIVSGVGHVPQLEVPEWTARQILDWLGKEGAPAAKAAASG